MEQSADYFLQLLKRSRWGKFKIYLGMSAGVGKTYRMLQEAHTLLRNGIDIRVGYVETHQRIDTQALTEGLPLIARRGIFYKGKELEEMDVQAVLNLHPEVVIVDELAHTNVPGSKNEKRWQDVLEILQAGISVISAVNIQHIESLHDEVRQVTGVEVTERVPDKVLREADEVVNIDLTADELITRLREGKIYAPTKIETALQHFFQPDKILQLRELALKEVASQVERKIENEVQKNARFRPERFLACISTREDTARKLIRKTARLASYYHARWFVLYIQTGRENSDKINLTAQRHLINNFQLATQMGAEVIRVRSNQVAQAIFDTAIEHEITTICMGKPHATLWQQLFNTDMFSRLLHKISDTDVDIVIIS